MSKATKPVVREHRIRFVTKDGSLVMNRRCADFVMTDLIFREHTLKADAREHGVNIISHIKLDPYTIEALVEWR